MSKQDAIDRINAEIDKDKSNYVKCVGEHLIKNVINDFNCHLFLQEDKTLKGSLDAMRKEAQKVAVSSVGVFTPEEGFKIVCDYYGVCAEEPQKASGKVVSLLDFM